MHNIFTYEKSYYTTGNYIDYLSREDKYKLLAKDIVTILKNFKTKNILDFGCGVGYLVKYLKLFNFDCVGYDCSKWALEHGKRYITHAITDDCNVLYQKYDTTIALDVFEHNTIEDIIYILGILKTKYLIVRIPVADYGQKNFYLEKSKFDKTHITCMDKEGWLKLFENCNFTKLSIIKEKTIWDSRGVLCCVFKRNLFL